MTPPRVSVVLPVRDAAATVERAARSILDSTLRELELIVIDDGSADNSAAIVRQISDPRLLLVQQDALGVCAAANRGTAEARAPVIARMDADDFSHPARLEKQLSLLHHSGANMVGCRVRIIDALGRAVGSMQRYEQWSNSLTEPGRIAAMRFVELPIVNPTLLAKREVFELGFRDGAWPEDYDLCLHALGQGHTAAKVPEVLFDWIDSGDRLTRTDERYSPEKPRLTCGVRAKPASRGCAGCLRRDSPCATSSRFRRKKSAREFMAYRSSPTPNSPRPMARR